MGVATISDGAGRFFITAFDAPGDATTSVPSAAPNLLPRVSRRGSR